MSVPHLVLPVDQKDDPPRGLNTNPDHPSFEQLLSDEWSDIVTEDRKHGILLRSGLVPLVVEASSALLKALEAEQASIAAASADPSARPRKPIEPIEFIASYLMRNNPKYKTKALLSPYRAAAMSPTSKCQTPRSARQ